MLAELADLVRSARPECDVVLCYLDVREPSLRSALDGHPGPSVVVPMLLSTGYHVTQDIPSMTTGRPAVRVANRLGPHSLLTSALIDRLTEAGGAPAEQIAMVASGSSHPGAAIDLARAANDLADRMQRTVTPVPLYADPAGRIAAMRGKGTVAVATYLLAEGFFADQVRAAAPGLPIAAPIGAHPAVVDLVWQRYDEAGGS